MIDGLFTGINSYKADGIPGSSAQDNRRSNVVFYGVPESPHKTSKLDHQKHELGIIVNTLSGIDSSITLASIKDIYRLVSLNLIVNFPVQFWLNFSEI